MREALKVDNYVVAAKSDVQTNTCALIQRTQNKLNCNSDIVVCVGLIAMYQC